ncbi:hypothetical protein [Glaciecola petra]|uniref:GGDEF domain-containing protein n=1 Tax=Glaciecola petra TaxID=3075602 RepID=A0ABU2ZX23_9ALTE|nr:hypothetical protein [Aestuariibacter sp. P117]MDT0596134.1 hypothetical protein [Aestuariibacter sp. P117]
MHSSAIYILGIVKKTAWVSAGIGCLGATLMYVFGQQPIQMSLIALLVCILLLVQAIYIHIYSYRSSNPLILMIGMTIAILLATTVTGGVYSRFVGLIPILPIMACLLIGKKKAIIYTLLLIGFLLLISYLREHIIDYTYQEANSNEFFPKVLWLNLAIVLGLTFALIFEDINAKSTIQLDNSGSENDVVENLNRVYSEHKIVSFADRIIYKFSNTKSSDLVVCLAKLEVSFIENSEQCLEQENLISFAKLIHVFLHPATDMLGLNENKQFLLCFSATDEHKAKQQCKNISRAIESRFAHLKVHIGMFVQDSAETSIDAKSIFQVVDLTLHSAKNELTPNTMNYADLLEIKSN